MASPNRRPGEKLSDSQIALAMAEHGSIAAAARALDVAYTTVGRRLAKIPELRGLADHGGSMSAHVRLRMVQLMGKAVDRLGAMLDSADPKEVVQAARLIGGWASSGALAAPTRETVEARTVRTVASEDRIAELARAQCTPAEIEACLVTEYQLAPDAAHERVEELGPEIVRHAQQGRAIIRTRAMAMADDPKMVAELARQYAYWSRAGYADEVGAAVERAEKAH